IGSGMPKRNRGGTGPAPCSSPLVAVLFLVILLQLPAGRRPRMSVAFSRKRRDLGLRDPGARPVFGVERKLALRISPVNQHPSKGLPKIEAGRRRPRQRVAELRREARQVAVEGRSHHVAPLWETNDRPSIEAPREQPCRGGEPELGQVNSKDDI